MSFCPSIRKWVLGNLAKTWVTRLLQTSTSLQQSGTSSVIDVSGDVGVSNIFFDGNYQDKGLLPNANATVVNPTTQLFTDATTAGNGVTVNI